MNGLMRLLFSPDDAQGGVPQDTPDPGLSPDLAAGLAGAVEADQAVEPAETEGGNPEAPAAAPAAETPVDWKAKYEADKAEWEKSRDEEVLRLASRAFDEERTKLAKTNPALWKAIMGRDPEAGMFPEPPKPLPADATVEQRMAAMKAEYDKKFAAYEKAQQDRESQAKYQAMLTDRAEKITAAATKHPIFNHPVIGDSAMRLLTNEFIVASQDPRATVNPEKLAGEVAKRFTDWLEGEKKGYVDGKKNVAARIPATPGPGSRQPGQAKSEIDLSTRKGRREGVLRLAEAAGSGTED